PHSLEVTPFEFNIKTVKYLPTAKAVNSHVGEKMPTAIYELKAEFETNIETRYLKIKLNKLGKMPSWRGVNGDAWMFIDEIEVY
ncbi:MAG: hypothetical protein ACOVP1_13285, partial [Bacteroidia bacterium]